MLIFRELAPKLALPPQPIVTCWGSWLEAVCYYAKHFSDVKKIVDRLDPEDAASVQITQECFNSSDIKNKLQYICCLFSIIPEIIKELQARNNVLQESLALVNRHCRHCPSKHMELQKLLLISWMQFLVKIEAIKQFVKFQDTCPGNRAKRKTNSPKKIFGVLLMYRWDLVT